MLTRDRAQGRTTKWSKTSSENSKIFEPQESV